VPNATDMFTLRIADSIPADIEVYSNDSYQSHGAETAFTKRIRYDPGVGPAADSIEVFFFSTPEARDAAAALIEAEAADGNIPAIPNQASESNTPSGVGLSHNGFTRGSQDATRSEDSETPTGWLEGEIDGRTPNVAHGTNIYGLVAIQQGTLTDP